MRSISISVIFTSLGRHSPRVNTSSDVELVNVVTNSRCANTGCMCMGFHMGRVSAFITSSAVIICWGVTLESLSIVRHDSQKLGSLSVRYGFIVTGSSVNASLYVSYIRFLIAMCSSMYISCPRPIPATMFDMR